MENRKRQRDWALKHRPEERKRKKDERREETLTDGREGEDPSTIIPVKSELSNLKDTRNLQAQYENLVK